MTKRGVKVGHEVGDRLVTDLLAVGGGVELLLVPLRGVGVHIADEALVEHQALQQALGRARADDDAVVQRGHHNGARVQPVYGAHCLDLRTDRDTRVRQQKNVRRALRMELLHADRLLGLTDRRGPPIGEDWSDFSAPGQGI